MLSQNDKTEIRSWIEEGIEKIEVRTDNKFEIIHLKLEQILEQTTRHNGGLKDNRSRIEALEKGQVEHTISCPVIEKVRTLEDESLTTKSVKKFMVKTIGFTATGMTIIWIVFQVIVKTIENIPQ